MRLTLEEDEVHLWSLPVDGFDEPSYRAQYGSLLSTEEIERSVKFRTERDRHRFVATRVFVRCALSRYEPIAPPAWLFSKTRWGQPLVSPLTGLARTLSFSISHTRETIVLAVARQPIIGVDIEEIAAYAPAVTAKQFFTSSEAAAISECQPEIRATLFCRYWTLKEAYLKALGKGLHQSLSSIEFRLDDSTIVATSRPKPGDRTEECWFWSMEFSPTHLGALCVKRSPADPWRLRGWRWQPLQPEQSWCWTELGRSA